MKNILTLLLILIGGTIYAQSGNWGLRQFETVVQLNAIFPSCATTSTAVNTSKLAYVNQSNTYYRWDCANSVWRPMADILITTDAGTPSLTCNGSTNFLVFNAAKDVYICNGTTWEQIGSVVTTDATLAGDGSVGTPLKIAQQGATSGQVLKWNGTTWAPAADAGGGGGATNLTVGNQNTNTLDVISDTGTDATVPAATASLAGLMSAADKTKLDSDNDQLITNEGSLTLGAGTGTTSLINSNTSGSTPITITVSTGLSSSESGNNLTLTNTDPDQSVTNEPLTISDGTNSETLAGQVLTVTGTNNVSAAYNIGTNTLTLNSVEHQQDLSLVGTTSPQLQLSDNSGVPGIAGDILINGIRGITVVNNSGDLDIRLPTGTSGQVLKYDGTNWIPDTDAGGATDLAIINRTNTTLDITSSTGADITVPQATTSLSGLMSGTDKTKLDSDTDQSPTNEVLTITDGTNTEALGGQTLGIFGGGMISSIYTPATNSLVISATEGDADPQNEGSLFVTAEAANTTGINSNTASSAKIIISGSLNQSVTENTGTNTITLTNTLADGTVYIGNVTNVAQSRTLSGDISLSGNTGNVIVDRIDGQPVTATGASTGQVLKWDGTAWIPSADNTGGAGSTDLSISNITSTTLDVVSSSGIDATVPAATSTLAGVMPAADKVKSDFTTVTQAVDLDAIEAASHAAVTVTDNARIDLTLTGQNIQADLLQNGATTGQVYKWNGTNWAPANDLGTTYTGGTGIDVTGTVITNTGDLLNNNEGSLSVLAGTGSTSIVRSNTTGSTDLTINAGTGIAISENTGTNEITITNGSPDQTVAITGAGTASVTGTYPNFTVTGTGVSSTLANNNILIGNASNVATAVNPSGDADISNTGNIIVDRIDNINVTATGATDGQLWRWNNGISTWIPSDENTQQMFVTGTTNPQLELSDNAGVSGGAGGILFTGTRGIITTNTGGDIDVALPTGTTGQLLRSNGTTWSAQNESLQGMRVNPTSGLNPTLQLSANDGTYTVPSGSMQMTATTPMTVTATGSSSINVELSQSGATTGQVLKWNGSNWIPDTDATGSGATDLTATGTAPNFNINSSTGTDVGIIQGAGTTITRSGNDLTFATLDQSPTNESLTVTDGTNSETLGGQTLTVTGSGGAVVSYNPATNTLNVNAGSSSGGDNWGSQVVAIGAGLSGDGTGGNPLVATDASITNELQTISNTSNSTSHTSTLSNTGGSTQFVEGNGVTLTTTGTSLDGVVTIGLLNPSYYHTLQEEGSNVTQRTALDFVGSAATLTDTGVKSQLAFDSDLNALASIATNGFYVRTGAGTSATRSLAAGTGISVSNVDGTAGNPTITNSAPDQTVVLNDGTGIDVTGTYPTFTVNATKVLREETFTATAAQTAFTMVYSAPAVSGTAYPIRVYRNGNELNWVASAPSITQYTYTGTTLTTFANDAGDVIRVNYLN